MKKNKSTGSRSESPAKSPKTGSGSGRYAYKGLDRVLHEKARLGILASLASHQDGLLFNDLKQLCALTDGNLSRHLGVLSEAGLIEIGGEDVSQSRRQTLYRLTDQGRERFAEYIGELERVIADAQVRTASATRGRGKSPGGWSPA